MFAYCVVMPFLQRFTVVVAANAPHRSLDSPVADTSATIQIDRDKSDDNALADAELCPLGADMKKNSSDDESILQAVCLSSLIAEEKYDVEGQIYISDSAVSVYGETEMIESDDIR